MGKALSLTESERESIARELFDARGERQGDELHGLCPFHDDKDPSFAYNVVKDVYNCFSCQVRGDLIRLWSKVKGTGNVTDDFKEFCRKYGLRLDAEHGKNDAAAPAATGAQPKKKKQAGKRISQAQIDAAWAAMPALPEAWIARLQEQRGWTADAINGLDLRMQTRRWDKRTGQVAEIEHADRIAIPVRDSDGKLRNIRCYKPGARKMKIFSFGPGIGGARLFPARPALPDSVVLVTEGEADAICAVSHGFDAITQTSRTKFWPADQAAVLAGRDVVICYDCDQPGQRYAVQAAESLAKVVQRVRLLTWPNWMGRQADGEWPKDHGEDLTDFFVKHGKSAADLRALIDAAEPVVVEEMRNACALDFFNSGPNGRMSFKPRLLADRLCAELEIISEPDTGLIHRWNGAFFERFPEDHLDARGITLLGDEAQQSRVRDAVFMAKRLSTMPHGRTLNDRENWVCTINGQLNLRTLELVPHRKDFYASYQLPVRFEPDAAGRCERFLQYLDETIQTPGPIAQVQEFAGYCLTREVKYEKAMLLLGPGADGKSKLMSVLEALTGPENCSAVSFQDLEDQFHRSSLYGKMLNISTEVGSKAMESAYFKAICSGDPISAAFKHQNAFQFRPCCKLIFAGNRLPRILDNSDGPFRRLLPISFKRQFLTDGDPDLLEKLMAERSDIFQWALVGLHRLWEQGAFTDCDETRQLMMDHRRANNPVLCFVEDMCIVGARETVKKQELYKEYKRYADTNGYSIMGRENFFRELYSAISNLKQHRPRTATGEREYYINGIGIDLAAQEK
jgi:putative DNA primase/helicase